MAQNTPLSVKHIVPYVTNLSQKDVNFNKENGS